MTFRRRAVLSALGTAGLASFAGCLGGVSGGDGDGEGPLALLRSTLESVAERETVPAPTNSLVADTETLAGVTDHFVRYSLQSATVLVYPDLLTHDYPTGARLWVVLSTYPEAGRGTVTLADGWGTVGSDVSGGERRLTASLSVDRVPVGPLFLQAYLVRADHRSDDVAPGDSEKLCETDPFVVADGRLVRHHHPSSRASLDQPGYRRVSAEGVYVLDFSGRTDGADWDVSFVAYKSAYVREKSARRKRRSEYVTDAMADGTADAFGAILHAEAEANGFQTRREKVEFLIDFVQNLPYVPDDVSTGYDDYTKHVVETLVDGGGDCEDTAVMLASLLQSSPFGYDTVLLLLPGHMAIGVYGDDLPGTYFEFESRRYYYVETTGRGWDVGEVPEQYQETSARVFQV